MPDSRERAQLNSQITSGLANMGSRLASHAPVPVDRRAQEDITRMGMSVNSASRAAAEKTVRQLRDPRAREDITRLGMSLNSRSRAVAEETARKAMLERLRKQEQELQNERDFLWGFEQDMTGGQLYYTPSSKHRTSAQAGTELAEVRRQIAELETWTQAEKYAGIKNAEDFALTAAWTRAQPPAAAIPVWQGDLKVRNIVRAIQAAEQSGASSLSSVSQVDQKWDHMTEEEQDVLLYYVGNGQLEEAGAYLDWLEESVNQREGVRIGQAVRGIDNDILRAGATGLYGVGTGIEGFVSSVVQSFSDDRLPTSAMQYGSLYIREDLADSGPQVAGSSVGQTLYDVATGLGYMAPSILVSSLTAGMGAPAAVAQAFGAGSMGVSARGSAYAQALDEGMSKEQARGYGTLVGVSEATLQYLLGGIGKLGGAVGNKLLPKIAAFDSGLKRVFATAGVWLGSEIGEEELQNHVIEPLLRTLIFGENFDLPTIEELTQTALVTALTTGVLETGEIANSGRGTAPAVENPNGEGYNENYKGILIGKSLGAKAKNYDIELPNKEIVHLTEGSHVSHVEVIAGKGRNRKIDEIDTLVHLFPGSSESEWQKKKGVGFIDYEGESYRVNLHWYEEPTVGRVKWKVKADKDGNWFYDDE